MLIITYTAAIFAAILNASSSVMQRIATSKPEAKRLFSHRFAYDMIRNRLFIIGFGLQVAAFASQAVALKNGPLIIVEPLLTCDLIFLLVLIHWYLKIKVKVRDWISAVAIIAGLSGMLIAARPRGGHLNYSATPWVILISLMGPIIIVLALIIRRLKSANIRALLAGIAAASTFALNAAFTKLALNLYATYGAKSLITSWPLYALIISGLISIYLMLNAFGSGPLAISVPVMEVVEPTLAVLIGVSIFGDNYSRSPLDISFGLIFTLLLVGGIVSLASSPRIHQAGEMGI